MHFTSLWLRQFRNYASLEFKPCAGTTVLYGANGSGKTNLLEAMHLLSLGRSHRTQTDREMIATGAPAALVHGETERMDGKHDVEIRLYSEERPLKRVLLFGKATPRIGDMMGHATCVMFGPEDLRIVRDGPAARRRFVDMQLSQIRPGYLRALKLYTKALDNRNALLKTQRAHPSADFAAQLESWDEQLAQSAAMVVEARRWFLRELARAASAQYAAIADDATETFELRYTGHLATVSEPITQMLAGLRRTRAEDLQRGYTTYGPHRDDVAMLLRNKELRAYGSQGQVRTAVLSMKLGEIGLIQAEMGDPPALLLDDVFSELDARRRGALLESASGVQTFLTCTDRADAAGARADVYYRVTQQADGHAVLDEG